MKITPVTPFELGERVDIDGQIDGIVTAYCWRTDDAQIEVSWWSNGQHYAEWFSLWRVTRSEQRYS